MPPKFATGSKVNKVKKAHGAKPQLGLVISFPPPPCFIATARVFLYLFI